MKDVGFCKHLFVARHCARCCVGCGWGERHKIKKKYQKESCLPSESPQARWGKTDGLKFLLMTTY